MNRHHHKRRSSPAKRRGGTLFASMNQGTNRIGLMSTYETPQAGQTANMNNADDEKQCPLCLNLFSQDHPSQKTQCCHRLVGISCYTRALSEDTHCDLCKYKFRRLKPDPVILTEQHHHIRRFQDRDSEENSSANLRNGGTTIITPGQSLDISSDAENLHDQRKDMANQWSTISNDKGKNIEGTNTSLKTMSAGSVEKEGQGVGPSYPDTSDQINSSGVHGGLGSDVSLVKPLASQQPKDHSVQSLLSPSISHHSGPALATPKPLAISQDTLLDLESLDLKATDYFKPFPTLEPGATLKQTDQTEHLLNSSGKAYINGGSPADTNNHGMTRAHEAIEKYRASCENLGFENHEAILGQLIRELSDIAGDSTTPKSFMPPAGMGFKGRSHQRTPSVTPSILSTSSKRLGWHSEQPTKCDHCSEMQNSLGTAFMRRFNAYPRQPCQSCNSLSDAVRDALDSLPN